MASRIYLVSRSGSELDDRSIQSLAQIQKGNLDAYVPIPSFIVRTTPDTVNFMTPSR